MRTNQALKNTFFSFGSYFILILFGFIVQRIFKDILGTEYLGVNSLFTNIMTGLNVVELGFGAAIVANMYRPVAENDICKINSLLKYYKRIYRCVAFIVLIAGLCIFPFVDDIVGDITAQINLKFIFLLYLFDSVVSYFLTYKRSILYANQKTYYTTAIHTCAVVITNILQIWLLINTKSFYLYLFTSIIFKLVENIVINIVVWKKYPEISDKTAAELDSNSKQDIKKKVQGLLFHKISTFFVFGTDNIIIAALPNLGIIWSGLYSSYSMITVKLTSLVDNIFSSVTASVGNLLVENDSEKAYEVFKNVKLINVWIYIFVSISFYYISYPFVELWMGKDFVLDWKTVLVIALNLFVGGLRASYGTFKNAAGIFYEDRFVPIVESIVNIIFSLLFGWIWGLKGVLMGTICSTLVLFIFSYPKYVYAKVFNKNKTTYVKDLIKSFGMMAIAFIITEICMIPTNRMTVYTKLVARIVICIIVPNIVMIILNYRTKEFEFIKLLLNKIIKRKV